MTDPNDSDDSWGDLARELGLNEPTFASPADEPPPEPTGDDAGEFEDAGLVEAEPASGDADTDEAEGDGEPGDDGQPGPGRKRRRRRRRRKKGGAAAGQPAEGAEANDDAAEAEADADDDAEVAAPVRVAVRVPVPREDPDEDEAAEEIEPSAVPLAAEEDTGSEVLRELIATWNVPSWDDIVGGLYRPDR